MNCNKCGAKNPDDAVFCNKCGNKLEYYSTSFSNPGKREQLNRNKIMKIAVAAMIVLGVAAFFLLFQVEKKSETIKTDKASSQFKEIDKESK